jgi:hypothetical protein
VGIGDGGVVIRAKLKTKLSPEGRTGQRLVRSACDRAARRGARLAASIRKIVDHRRVDNQGVPGIVAFDVKIRQLLDAHEVDAVERLAVRLVEGERAGTVSIIRIGGLACHHIGEVDIGKVDQVRIRNRPIPSKTDDLSCEILGAIGHELAGIAVAVRKSHRRRACGPASCRCRSSLARRLGDHRSTSRRSHPSELKGGVGASGNFQADGICSIG